MIRISPFWRIRAAGPDDSVGEEKGTILLAPGEGWGSGSHETTQLCLQAIALGFPWRELGRFQVLDFGSGSGILSIAAAKLGGTVEAVEIEEEGIVHARKNAELNGVFDAISFLREIDPSGPPCDLVVANILRPVLLEYAPVLVKRLKSNGVLALSGLLAPEVPEISARFAGILGGRSPEVYRRGEWRAVVWRG